LLQRIVVEWLKAGNLPAHAERARRTYRSHRDRMIAALRRDLPEVSMVVPQGGYYVWLSLPREIDADALSRRAADAGVAVIAGSKFFAGGGIGYPRNEGPPKNRMRLTYSFADGEEIDEGVRRLGKALRSMRA
jgi:2-aminoadipate transaminase